ncbi:DUF4357 domain-containing protein [Sphingomonas sp. HH69]
MQIDVSLEVFKALTARLSYDGQSYSDLIRDLLAQDSPLEADSMGESDYGTDHSVFMKQANEGGFASRKLWLPHRTELRARYRQREYRARIDNNAWLDEGGNHHSSPSAAAYAITGNNVNGLRFWEARLPTGSTWCRLEALVTK